jgi:hypothetical protein
MEALFKKLNYKNQKRVLLLNAPASFEAASTWLSSHAVIHDHPDNQPYEFGMVFVTSQKILNKTAPIIADAIPGEGVIWFCYPKASSKNYVCDINRDHGWQICEKLQLKAVRQVAIDEDWSALRYRRINSIQMAQGILKN